MNAPSVAVVQWPIYPSIRACRTFEGLATAGATPAAALETKLPVSYFADERASGSYLCSHGESFGDVRRAPGRRSSADAAFASSPRNVGESCDCLSSRTAPPLNILRTSYDNVAFTMSTNLAAALHKRFRSQTRLYLYRLVILTGEAFGQVQYPA